MIDYDELPPAQIRFGACFDERAFAVEMKRLNVEGAPVQWCAGAAAVVHFFEESTAGIIALMSFDAKAAQAAGMDGIVIAALLCHEAVHVMQESRRWMREKKPGSEWEAFTVQFVAQRFMEAYVAWGAR